MVRTNTAFASSFNLERDGERDYSKIKKKAKEQKFSWSGLIISLSIAFFIVIAAALVLSICNQSLEAGKVQAQFTAEKNISQIFK